MRSALLLILALLPLSSHAEGSRLDRIKETGILVAAYREQSIPFSYLDAGRPTGFGVQLTQHVANALQQALGLDRLTIRWNPVTLSTRIPLIANGAVDIECATTTPTPERARLVSFSQPYFAGREGFLVKASISAQSTDDLASLRVSVAANSLMEETLHDRWRDQPADRVISASNNTAAMRALVKGDVDAFAGDDVILAGELLKSGQPVGDYRFIPSGSADTQYACVLPKDDEPFKRLVEGVLESLRQSGELDRLYRTWFASPIPPHGRPLPDFLSVGRQ